MTNEQRNDIIKDLELDTTLYAAHEQLYPRWEAVYGIVIGFLITGYFQTDVPFLKILFCSIGIYLTACWAIMVGTNYRWARDRKKRINLLRRQVEKEIDARSGGTLTLFQPIGNPEDAKTSTWKLRKRLPWALLLVWAILVGYGVLEALKKRGGVKPSIVSASYVTTNLSSADLAAWVQAIGSVIAIIAAALIAILQSRAQHRSALALHKEEQRDARVAIARTLSTLAGNCTKAVAHSADQLRDRTAVHNIASGQVHFDLGELRRLDTAIASIPLHSLPDTLVSPTMILSATMRQFVAMVESTILVHRQMDSGAFEELFRAFKGMNETLKATCKDIEAEVNRIQGET